MCLINDTKWCCVDVFYVNHLVHIMYTVMHKMNLSSWQSEADILNCKEPCSNQLIQVNVTGSTLYQNRNTMNIFLFKCEDPLCTMRPLQYLKLSPQHFEIKS